MSAEKSGPLPSKAALMNPLSANESSAWMHPDATAEQREALEIAHNLIEAGVPVFAAPPDPDRPGHYRLPKHWEKTIPAMVNLERWKPGWALAAVGGHVADFLDVDPRNGGDVSLAELEAAGHMPRSFGQQETPSGGAHYIISPTGERKGSPMPGLDLQSGDENGVGRGFVFIAPTVRPSKDPATLGQLRAYRWVKSPDPEELEEWKGAHDPSTEGIVSRFHAKRTAKTTRTTPTVSIVDPDDPFMTSTSVAGTGTPAGAEEVMRRVQELARDLEAAPMGLGEKLANDLSFQAGQYVGAGQVTAEAVLEVMLAALNGWTWDSPGDQADLEWKVRRGVAEGAQKPRPWTAATIRTPASAERQDLAEAITGQDRFTDAFLAEVVARDALIGRFCRTTGLGWLEWDGVRWATVDEGAAVEAVRQHALRQYVAALEAERAKASSGEFGDGYELDGWKKAQNANKLRAVLGLAGNVAGVRRNAEDFDRHHDLLNTPGGVVDLATGEVSPHDPDLMFTKVTRVDYRPGATAEAFTKALEAVPADALGWLQVRLGQATTGHMTSDDRMVMLSGGGSNGKTAVMEAMYRALGGFAALVPSTLLLRGKSSGAATPEKMTIRGVRQAYMEETPEERELDTQALKEVVGTPSITGRELYKGFVTFGATHSLFLNTNYPPRVVETDNGTWRRLVRLDFPYRYMKPGEDLERETDRRGDPTLKARLATVEAQEAALAWLVDGARAWYAAGQVFPDDPATVTADTKAWRHESDLILRYLDECMTFDRDRWVSGQEVWGHFVDWVKSQGQREISQALFTSRLKAHTALPAYVQIGQVMATRPGMSRREDPFAAAQEALPKRMRAVIGLCFKSNEE